MTVPSLPTPSVDPLKPDVWGAQRNNWDLAGHNADGTTRVQAVYQKVLGTDVISGNDNLIWPVIKGVFQPKGPTHLVIPEITAGVQGVAAVAFRFVYNQTVAAGTSLTPRVVLTGWPAGTTQVKIGTLYDGGGRVGGPIYLTGLDPTKPVTWEIQYFFESFAFNVLDNPNPTQLAVLDQKAGSGAWNGRRFVAAADYSGSAVHVYEVGAQFATRLKADYVAAYALSGSPMGVCFTPDGKYLFVASFIPAPSVVTQISAADWTVVRNITMPAGATVVGVESSSDSAYVWAADTTNHQMIPIRVSDGAVGTPIAMPGGVQPSRPRRRNKVGTNIYVGTTSGAGTVQELVPTGGTWPAVGSLGTTISVPDANHDIRDVCFSPDGTKLWAVSNMGKFVKEVDLGSMTTTGRSVTPQLNPWSAGTVGGALVIVGDDDGTFKNYEYLDLATLTRYDYVSLNGGGANGRDLAIASDGAQFVACQTAGKIFEYFGAMLYINPSGSSGLIDTYARMTAPDVVAATGD